MLHAISLPARPLSSSSSQAAHCKSVLIYFVPGNPGLVEHYRAYLQTLRDLIDGWSSSSSSPSPSSSSPVRFHIYAQDYPGFSDDDGHTPFTWPDNPPFDVEHQIRTTVSKLRELQRIDPVDPGSTDVKDDIPGPFDHVILIGHSAGSFISLQIMHRSFRDPTLFLPLPLPGGVGGVGPSPSLAAGNGGSGQPPPWLRGGIFLFATISHLAASSSGKRLALLRRLPSIEHLIVPVLVTTLLHRVAPWSLLRFIARHFAGLSPYAADITATWLKSRDGLWQAMHMGFDELDVIAGSDGWDSRLWGDEVEVALEEEQRGEAVDIEKTLQQDDRHPALITPSPSPAPPAPSTSSLPSLYFFYGKKDEWVANEHRDEFVARRREEAAKKGGGASRTRIVVDEGGRLPHAFCIHDSEVVAEKTNVWIREMYGL